MGAMVWARIGLILVVAAVSAACTSDGGDCFSPIDDFIPPATPDAGGGAGPAGGGQCAAWVEIGGVDFNWYRDMRFEGWEFQIDPAELNPYEEIATEVTHLVLPVAEATVWSVSGLDPEAFLVMRSAPDGELFFIVKGESGVTTPNVEAVLCRYATGSAFVLEERCADVEPQPSD